MPPRWRELSPHVVPDMLEPVESADELEGAWNSAISSEEVRNDLLTTMVQSTSQGDVSRVPSSELKLTEEEPEVELEVLIQW